jgi:hypothetical protein
MRLPHAEQVIVDEAKVRDYLLSLEHPVGRSKAVFFRALGFTDTRWEELRQELMRLVRTEDAELGPASPFGQKYIVRGRIMSPTGRSAFVKTAWIVLASEVIPRFVTAFPGERT